MYKIQTTFTEKIFVFAMVCSVWTQLRVASIIGISEILILLIAFLGKYSYSEDMPEYYYAQSQYVKVVAFIIPIGIVWNFMTANSQFQMAHDFFAFIYVGILVYRVLNRMKIYENLMGILYNYFFFETIINVVYFAMYSAGMGMYYEERFEGFGTDPNQLAEVLLLVPWMCLYFLRKLREEKPSNAFFARLVCIACLVSSVYIGLLTESDSFNLSLVIGLIVYLLLETGKILSTGQGSKIVLLLDVVGIGYGLSHASQLMVKFSEIFTKTAEDANQLVGRQKVWLHGFQAFLNSPIFGNGPGAFSGNWWAFGNMETHNTYIYIMMDFGIIGLFLLLVILFRAGKMTRIAQASEMTAAFVGFLIFNWFHSFHRMPLFWFFIYMFISVGLYEWNSFYEMEET